VRYLQIGGDSWNRCHEGWLNIDQAFRQEGLREGQVGTDDKGAHNMVLSFSSRTRLPFRSQSVQLIYSEHFLEHLLPSDGLAVVREAYRVLVPGGVLRIATPDLEAYMCGYARGAKATFEGRPFLQQHASRFPPMQRLGRGAPSDAAVVNNIFRNYGHQWVYDLEELTRLAVDAGVPEASVCRSNRAARGLPRELHRAIRRATGPRNESLACWLDQAVREDESLYVQIYKGEPWAQPQNGSLRVPTCASPPGWLPCPSA